MPPVQNGRRQVRPLHLALRVLVEPLCVRLQPRRRRRRWSCCPRWVRLRRGSETFVTCESRTAEQAGSGSSIMLSSMTWSPGSGSTRRQHDLPGGQILVQVKLEVKLLVHTWAAALAKGDAAASCACSRCCCGAAPAGPGSWVGSGGKVSPMLGAENPSDSAAACLVCGASCRERPESVTEV